MITETSAVAFRQNLGEMLNKVQYRHDSIVINQDGRPVAALIDRNHSRCGRYSRAQYAAGGEGRLLITGDHDLLAFAERHPIITPAEFWQRHGAVAI